MENKKENNDVWYWHGKSSLGAGSNAVNQGDICPDTIEDDPRFEKWIADGTIQSETYVSFEADQVIKLALAEARVIELEGVVSEMKETVKELSNQKKPRSSKKAAQELADAIAYSKELEKELKEAKKK